jgi:signal transduction histidine kinase
VTQAAPGDSEGRVLLKSGTGRDTAMTLAVLERAGIPGFACDTLEQLVAELARGAGALMVVEEVLADAAALQLVRALEDQPPWSDVPVMVLARTGADSRAITQAMALLGNVTVIERPVRVSTFISAIRSALRARHRQYELRALLEGLEEADRRKTEFLATLAHELRSPLAPLKMALSLLQMKPLPPEAARPHYETMGRQVDHMVRLIDDLMEVSRITRGKIELQPQTIELGAVVRDALELSRPLLESARHELRVRGLERDWRVSGDGVRLTQVFANLFNNAAKYTPAGGVVEVEIEGQPPHVRVHVRDNGVGLERGMLDEVFGMFVQVSGSARAAQGGLGIGLTLVRNLVELHGGRVTAASEGLGRGCEFIVELPLAAPLPASEPAAAINGDGLRGARILVVDDNRDAADSLGVLLRALGADVRVAHAGDEALSLAAEWQPEIAILDVGMPGMDGCELASRLRADPRYEHLLMVALTGWGQPADRERIAAAGFAHHFLKPLDIASLVEAVSSSLSPLGRGPG